ncbi:hypothetical protein BC830DRAFT_1115259 [Chytriomyces sp. MP71]|nr:hypothetical protein BC830DRAFT_1115259 [Chytriomyces sp. MP71]
MFARPSSTSSRSHPKNANVSTSSEKVLGLAPEGRQAPMYLRAESPRVPFTVSAPVKNLPVSAAISAEGLTDKEREKMDREKEFPPQKLGENGIQQGKPDSKRKDVVIHVFDENRNAKRDFYCKQYLLLREMKFFTYLADRAAATACQVDIDVHCDIEVFEWLMMFITRQRPSLEPRSVVSILISSNFLQMGALQDICLDYIHDHINDIIKVPIDLNCISKPLLQRLSELFSLVDLDEVIDPKDKLSSKLHMHKIQHIIEHANHPKHHEINEKERTPKTHFVSPPVPKTGDTDDTSSDSARQPTAAPIDPNLKTWLRKCKKCAKIYPKHEEAYLECEDGVVAIDFHGEVSSMHDPDFSFNFNMWVAELILDGLSWRDVLWRIWGLIHHANCIKCKKRFAFIDFACCRRHIDTAIFPNSGGIAEQSSDSKRGRYLCCGESVYRFNPFNASKGCSLSHHVLEPEFKKTIIHRTFETHFDLVVKPILDLGSEQAKPDTIQYINDVRCFRTFGEWNEGVTPIQVTGFEINLII